MFSVVSFYSPAFEPCVFVKVTGDRLCKKMSQALTQCNLIYFFNPTKFLSFLNFNFVSYVLISSRSLIFSVNKVNHNRIILS